MKLGILDTVPPKYYEAEGVVRDADRFVTMLESVGFSGEIIAYHVAAGEFPPSTNACDAYLITGSPASAYDNDKWIQQLKAFVRQLHTEQKQLVGICFGHQLIAEALGGKVVESPNGWQAGLWAFEVSDGWTENIVNPVKIYHLNKDQVVQLPDGAAHMGESEMCVNSMYTVGDHILSIQGHPELPLDAVIGYINDLGDTLPPPVVTRAMQSFEEAEPDSERVARWIREFLERP